MNGRNIAHDFGLPDEPYPPTCPCAECRRLAITPNEAERHEQAVGRWRQLRKVIAAYEVRDMKEER